jgi:DNA-binding HxlR family transcriptional regulator
LESELSTNCKHQQYLLDTDRMSPPVSPHDDSVSAEPSSAAGRASGILSPGQIFDPVARALDVVGDRWSLVLVRQLIGGPKGFQELRVRTGIAPRVLSSRLRQLTSDGFVKAVTEGTRSIYGVTDHGRSLEPIISSIARWWVRHGIADLQVDTGQFTATSPQSIIESLPFLLREEARDANVTFEIRLTGEGGGVWTVAIRAGHCEIQPDFADHADVRYTADAQFWCGVALGVVDARDGIKRGLLKKDGSAQAMDHYFHQISREGAELDPIADAVSDSINDKN